MKAVFIAFDQAYYERIIDLLKSMNSRGFTAWEQVFGRGSETGDPHYGTHAWPSLCSAIMTMVADDHVDLLLEKLHQMDVQTPKLGLRAFAWSVEKSI